MKKSYRKCNEENVELPLSFNLGSLPDLTMPSGMFDVEDDPRSIYLFNEVYPDTIATVIQKINSINYLDARKEKEAAANEQTYIRHPIKLYLSSYGGSVYDGLGLVGTILASTTPIHTYTTGKVMSMGFILAIVGDLRFTTPYTTYMYHSVSSVAWGKFQEIVESLDETTRLQKMLDDLTVNYTSILQETLDDVHTRKFDWYFDAQTALTLNCVDTVL